MNEEQRQAIERHFGFGVTMRLDSTEGTLVIYRFPENGHEFDRETSQKHLTVGSIYTIEQTEVYDYNTDIYLKEFPGIRFNSVQFADIDD